MYDLWGYGESDLGLIFWVSWGFEEVKDVFGVVDFVVERFLYFFIGLFFICMGLVVIIYVYGMDEGMNVWC